MRCLANRSFEYRREGVMCYFQRKIGIEFVHVGHSAADYENVRIECVDDQSQTTRKPINITAPDQPSEAIPVAHFCDNAVRRQFSFSVTSIVSLETGSGDPARQTTMFAAEAGRSWDLCDIRNRQRIVTPFTRAIVWSMMRPPADGNAGARAGAEDDRKDNVVARARSIDRLRGGQAIGIGLDPDLASQCGAKVFFNRPAN